MKESTALILLLSYPEIIDYQNIMILIIVVLCHFKFLKLFIRQTKNAFLTFIAKDLLEQIANSQPVTYPTLTKRVQYQQLPMRFDELRDYFGTHLINNGILEAEQNWLWKNTY